MLKVSKIIFSAGFPGLLLYIIMALVVPKQYQAEDPRQDSIRRLKCLHAKKRLTTQNQNINKCKTFLSNSVNID